MNANFDTWSSRSNSITDDVFDEISQPLSPITSHPSNDTWLDSLFPNAKLMTDALTSYPNTNPNEYYGSTGNKNGFRTELESSCDMTRNTTFENDFFSSACTSGTISPVIKIETCDDYGIPNPVDLNIKLEVIKKAKDLTPKSLESIFDTKEVLKDAVKREHNVGCESQPATIGIQSEGCKRKRVTRKKLTEVQKQAHNKIEKKYRININAKIAGLQKIIPSVASEKTAFETGMDKKVENDCSSQRLNKSMILERATDYILHLKNREKKLENEVNDMKIKMALLGGSNLGYNAGANQY